MKRINLVHLRKRAGMSQRELADLLQVRPSFLSAIENGRSRLPEEKLEKIKEIFEIDDLEEYLEDEAEPAIPPHTHNSEETDTITQLLNRFHQLAHEREKSHVGHDADAAERIEYLERRNDRLSDRVDDLRDEVDRMRDEILRLKELLVAHGIKY